MVPFDLAIPIIGVTVANLAFTYFSVKRLQRSRQMSPSLNVTSEEIIRCIDSLNINDIRKTALKVRYVKRIEKWRDISQKAQKTQTQIDTYNIALSATITVITASEIAIENVLPFISVGITIALLSSGNTFLLSYSAQNGLKDKYLEFKHSAELLESEIWMYLTGADEYVDGSHQQFAASAIISSESIILANTERQVKNGRKRKKEIDENGRAIPHDEGLGAEDDGNITNPAPTDTAPKFSKQSVDSEMTAMRSPMSDKPITPTDVVASNKAQRRPIYPLHGQGED